jgi:hypothetical protein
MLHTLTSQIGLLVLALVCVLVFAKGGTAERIAAVLVAASWVGLLVWQAVSRQRVPEIALLVSDFVVATGFLALAVRYASLWLGTGMLFQGAAFAMHLFHLTDPTAGPYTSATWIYVLAVNLLSYAVLVTIAGAAVVTWRGRIKARRSAAP